MVLKKKTTRMQSWSTSWRGRVTALAAGAGLAMMALVIVRTTLTARIPIGEEVPVEWCEGGRWLDVVAARGQEVLVHAHLNSRHPGTQPAPGGEGGSSGVQALRGFVCSKGGPVVVAFGGEGGAVREGVLVTDVIALRAAAASLGALRGQRDEALPPASGSGSFPVVADFNLGPEAPFKVCARFEEGIHRQRNEGVDLGRDHDEPCMHLDVFPAGDVDGNAAGEFLARLAAASDALSLGVQPPSGALGDITAARGAEAPVLRGAALARAEEPGESVPITILLPPHSAKALEEEGAGVCASEWVRRRRWAPAGTETSACPALGAEGDAGGLGAGPELLADAGLLVETVVFDVSTGKGAEEAVDVVSRLVLAGSPARLLSVVLQPARRAAEQEDAAEGGGAGDVVSRLVLAGSPARLLIARVVTDAGGIELGGGGSSIVAWADVLEESGAAAEGKGATGCGGLGTGCAEAACRSLSSAGEALGLALGSDTCPRGVTASSFFPVFPQPADVCPQQLLLSPTVLAHSPTCGVEYTPIADHLRTLAEPLVATARRCENMNGEEGAEHAMSGGRLHDVLLMCGELGAMRAIADSSSRLPPRQVRAQVQRAVRDTIEADPGALMPE